MERRMAETITLEELRAKLERREEMVLLEALPREDYEQAHLPGALNLPLDQLESLAPRLVPARDAQVVVYCKNEACRNSELAARRLRRLGYTNVRDYSAGKAEWIAAGLPVEHGLAAAA
jgi:rhodanese-related sulfurtransferase